MTNAETLLSLAERVEAASADETVSLLFDAFDLTNWRSKRRGSLVTHNPQWFAFVEFIRGRGFIDAAMSLVPEGWFLQFSDWQHPTLRARGPWQAILVQDRDDLSGVFDARCDHAATPALALTAAALRAHASQSQEPSK